MGRGARNSTRWKKDRQRKKKARVKRIAATPKPEATAGK